MGRVYPLAEKQPRANVLNVLNVLTHGAPSMANGRSLMSGAIRRAASAVAATAGFAPSSLSKEQARALPDSKGGEEPKQLQTSRADIHTYFTEIGGTRLLYSAENHVRIKLLLEDAGPVAVGNDAQIEPVLSGRGVLLETAPGPAFEQTLSKGDRIYIAAETVNRVKVQIEPIPWLEQIDLDIARVGAAVAGAAQTIVQGIGSAIGALGGGAPTAAPSPTTSNGKRLDQIPCPQPPPGRGIVPRLTPLTRFPPSPRMRR